MATSEAQKRAVQKHLKEQYTELRFRVKKDVAILIKQRAAAKELSFRAYILKLIIEDMVSDPSYSGPSDFVSYPLKDILNVQSHEEYDALMSSKHHVNEKIGDIIIKEIKSRHK